MWLETKKARNFNAVVWVLGEVNGYEERNRCIVIYFVDECHRQATRRFNPVDPELDPSSGKARGAPSTGAGRERGCDGIGRALAFPSKKEQAVDLVGF